MQHRPFLVSDRNSNLTLCSVWYLVNCLPDNPLVVLLGYRIGFEARFQEIPDIRSNLFLHLRVQQSSRVGLQPQHSSVAGSLGFMLMSADAEALSHMYAIVVLQHHAEVI